MSGVADLRFDEALWDKATALRRAEWRSTIDDVLHGGVFGEPLQGRYLLVSHGDDSLVIEALDEDGYVQHTVTVPRAPLAEPVREYLAIIRSMDDGVRERDASWFEAVDMAKKVVHDKAAAVLAREAPDLSSDKHTLRKLFTMLFALMVDTTLLAHARGHGRPRLR